MARIEALSILLESTGKEFLAELYGKTIENVMKGLVSSTMKNQDLSGNPTSGSVEAKRFVNAKSQKYGTARQGGKGNAVKVKPVVVAITEDSEIVEEIENKDIQLYGVDGLLNRRASNHVLRMASELDTEFFKVAADNATAVETASGLSVEEELEAVIQECENTQNDFVDGVPREMMHLVLNTAYYGKVRNTLDKTSRANVDSTAEEFYAWHGVECKSCTHLPKNVKYILMVTGAVAQPIMANQYTAEKIPLSEAFGVSLFYHYGTACVMPDLIFKGVIATQSEDPKTTDAENKGGTD